MNRAKEDCLPLPTASGEDPVVLLDSESFLVKTHLSRVNAGRADEAGVEISGIDWALSESGTGVAAINKQAEGALSSKKSLNTQRADRSEAIKQSCDSLLCKSISAMFLFLR